MHSLNNLLKDIELDKDTVSFKKFMIVLNTFCKLPAVKRSQSNSSNLVKRCYTNPNPNVSQALMRIVEMIHIKIEEKFKNYRDAFRRFNVDFNDYISFSEFCKGLESIGISLKLSDYRQVYDLIDENKNGQISYTEFCKIAHIIDKQPLPAEQKPK